MDSEKNNMIWRIEAGTIVKIILVGLVFWLAFFLREVIFVILLAVVSASAIEPMTKWFVARRIPRTLAVLIIYFGVAIIFVGTFYFLIIPLLTDLQIFLVALPGYLGAFSSAYSNLAPTSDGLISLTGSRSAVENLIGNLPISDIVSQINSVVSVFSRNALAAASSILGGVLSLLLIVVLSFYLSVQQDGITNFLKTLSPSKHRKYVINLWGRAETKIGLWMQGQLLLGVIVAVLVYLGLTLLGVKHALLLGFLAGVFELIPLFGPILAAIPAVAIAFIDGGLTSGLLVIGLYVIIQQFESQLIYPLVVKKVIGVPPIISIVALVIGAKLAGFVGLLLSVPVAAILMEFFNDLEKNRVLEEQKEK